MTVDELRKALEGVPGDMPVAIKDECWWRDPEAATVSALYDVGDMGIGSDEPVNAYGSRVEAPRMPYFLID